MSKAVTVLSPGHLATNPRLYKEALALQEAGYQVRAISGCCRSYEASIDAVLAEKLLSPYSVPFGPVMSPRMVYLRQSVTRRLAAAAFATGIAWSRVAEAAQHPIAFDLAAAAMSEPADLYIAHYVAALPAAARAAARYGAHYAFDAEDFHLGDAAEGPDQERINAVIRAIENRYLPGVAYISAASPGIADAYSSTYRIPSPTVILNVFPRAQAGPAPRTGRAPDRQRSLYWFSQTIGPRRGIECALKAVARTRTRPCLTLRGNANLSFVAELRAIASALEIEDLLVILPTAPPEQMEVLAAEHDAGFVGETGHSKNRRIMLTNKQFTYLLAGLPTILSDIPSHRAFAAENVGAAFLYANDDPESLADVIDRLFSDETLRVNAAAEAWRLGQEKFSWELESTKLVACVEKVLGKA